VGTGSNARHCGKRGEKREEEKIKRKKKTVAGNHEKSMRH
jgi:hypothetical protein